MSNKRDRQRSIPLTEKAKGGPELRMVGPTDQDPQEPQEEKIHFIIEPAKLLVRVMMAKYAVRPDGTRRMVNEFATQQEVPVYPHPTDVDLWKRPLEKLVNSAINRAHVDEEAHERAKMEERAQQQAALLQAIGMAGVGGEPPPPPQENENGL